MKSDKLSIKLISLQWKLMNLQKKLMNFQLTNHDFSMKKLMKISYCLSRVSLWMKSLSMKRFFLITGTFKFCSKIICSNQFFEPFFIIYKHLEFVLFLTHGKLDRLRALGKCFAFMKWSMLQKSQIETKLVF